MDGKAQEANNPAHRSPASKVREDPDGGLLHGGFLIRHFFEDFQGATPASSGRGGLRLALHLLSFTIVILQ